MKAAFFAVALVLSASAVQSQTPLIPEEIADPADWISASEKSYPIEIIDAGGTHALTASGRQIMLLSSSEHGPGTRIRVRFRLTDPAKTISLNIASGLSEPANARERGNYVSVVGRGGAVTWTAFDPTSTDRRPEVRGTYKPHFDVARSLAWPEELRRNVEADIVASKPLEERWLDLEILLRKGGYDVSIDGIPLAAVRASEIDTNGFCRLIASAAAELSELKIENAGEPDDNWIYWPVSLQSIINAGEIDGEKVNRVHLEEMAKGVWKAEGVPFEFAAPTIEGLDHVDLGASWFRQGNLDGRFSGRGTDALASRWPGSTIVDPARLTLRLPMARYRALHLLAAVDGGSDSVPVITAQFFRSQAGFPKSFSKIVNAEKMGASTLYKIVIPIDSAQLAEFDDLDFIELELTKAVNLYRAAPDPMFYSFHGAGLPSSVRVFALTAERYNLDVKLEASEYGHIWTAPQTPSYQVVLRNRQGPARPVKLELQAVSLDESKKSRVAKTVQLPADRDQSLTVDLELPLEAYGHHEVELTVVDGEQTQTERRSLAYLRKDDRERGDWDFGKGPLFGFWNWRGGHVTPSADKQLLVMAKAGIETTPGSYNDLMRRDGDAVNKVLAKYGIFTLKFAGAGDHYTTARFAGTLKNEGLEKAREDFLTKIEETKNEAGPHSRPLFISWYPEPSIGPLTHGIFPEFIGEPAHEYSDYENERYEMFLNGFLEGAKIMRENYPDVKNMMPHGDPAFVVHFLQRNPEVAQLLDGITVDIPCFERLPEQQWHQVSIHRFHMAKTEMAKAGLTDPLLPMYEGPCVPSGPGALSLQEHADLSIRNSLILLAYGINIQNGGFPGFDTASYWGEQHYGHGVFNRISLETPKPAYAAIATLTRHLNRKNFEKWVPTGSNSVYALQFKHYRTRELVHVLWTLRGSREVTIEGEEIEVYDQMDNLVEQKREGGKTTFSITTSPCYIQGLSADAVITLGTPDHSDSKPAEIAKKLANLGDGLWKLTTVEEPEYAESHLPYIYRYPSPMTVEAVEAPAEQGGKALSIHFPDPEKDRVFVPYYSTLTPPEPIEIPGKGSHLGLWVKGASDWGRAIYVVRDAKGEQWINVGRRDQWNCDDLHSWMSFNFDGWRYLKMELPANSGWDQFREPGFVWWGPYSSGDGVVDLPLKLEKVIIERRTHVMYVNDPQPADRSDVLLGDLFVEYENPEDATAEAVRKSRLRIPTPQDVPDLGNPIQQLLTDGAAPPIEIERITLPPQMADGTRCSVHFPIVEGAKTYDVWASPYEDGRGALQLGKAWTEPGKEIRGLRPNRDFYLFLTHTDAEGAVSKPSKPFKIHLEDFFGMK